MHTYTRTRARARTHTHTHTHKHTHIIESKPLIYFLFLENVIEITLTIKCNVFFDNSEKLLIF
jgi:hypothetical protein